MTEDKGKDDSAADGTVLSPDDLDITREESVVEIDEGRYVISSDGATPSVPDESDTTAEETDPPEVEQTLPPVTEQEFHQWLGERLSSADSEYAFDISASFEGDLSQKAFYSNDVVSTFENLMVWYATNVGGDTPTEDVIGILLAESDLSIRFPASSLRGFAESQGLDGSDTLEALYVAAHKSGGIRFPAEDD